MEWKSALKNNTRKETICAVVVTYNRKILLQQSLDALLLQTTPLDSIIIIDNASNDGTEELLKQNYLPNTIFDYIRLSENMGGAGGFYEGIKRGYVQGFDWIWLMDDDVKADCNALKNLLRHATEGKAIQTSRYSLDGSKVQWGNFFNIHTLLEYKASGNINVACFEGLFLHRELVEKVGFPDKNFFIAEDDKEYGYRLAKHTNIICVEDAILYRLIKEEKAEIKSIFNTGLRERRRINIFNYWRAYYHLRNLAFIVRKHSISNISKISFLRITLNNMVGVLLYDDYKLIRLGILIKAFFDGIYDRFGKTVDPQEYRFLIRCRQNEDLKR